MGLSKIAKKPISFPSTVSIVEQPGSLTISSGQKARSLTVPSGVLLDLSGGVCKISCVENISNVAVVGTFASKLKTVISDMQNPKKKTVNLVGVGFKAFKANGGFLVLSLGFSHLIAVGIPEGLSLEIRENNKIDISGFTEEVSSFASDLCKLRQWDPCKRNGVVVDGSYLRYKEGKKK